MTLWFRLFSSFLSEKAMAPHSSPVAWKMLWMEEPGRLQSLGSLGVGHDWVTSLSLFTFMHWRRKWQPTPVFLPGESQEWGSLVGCCLWGHTGSDITKRLSSSSILVIITSPPQDSERYSDLLQLIFKKIWPHHAACGILVPQLGVEPTPPALKA